MSSGWGSAISRSTESNPRTKNAVAKISQARRVRRSGASAGPLRRLGGCVTSGIEDGGPGRFRPSRDVVLPGGDPPSTFVLVGRLALIRRCGLGAGGVVAAAMLDPI